MDPRTGFGPVTSCFRDSRSTVELPGVKKMRDAVDLVPPFFLLTYMPLIFITGISISDLRKKSSSYKEKAR
jgi:hypothetical protein